MLTIRDLKPLDLGNDYWVVINGLCGSDTARGFSISAPDIIITQQPENIESCEGTNVTFTVTAEPVGGTSLRYQWQKDGIPLQDNSRISGSTTNTLTISNINLSDNGTYVVIITVEPFGFSKSSVPATLTIKTKPNITQQPPATINLNTGETLTLTVEVEGTDPLNYQWFKDGSPIDSATNPTFEKENVSTDDAGIYYCTITNECGSTKSQDITVVVTTKIYMEIVPEASNGTYIVSAPNPFFETSLIRISTSESGNARLVILDHTGKEIIQLFQGIISFGTTEFKLNSKDYSLTSGLYLVKLELNGKVYTKFIVLAK